VSPPSPLDVGQRRQGLPARRGRGGARRGGCIPSDRGSAGRSGRAGAATAPSASAEVFSAAPLSEPETSSAGASSGAFNHSYPIQAPPLPGGLTPQVSLNYSAQIVDGLTSSTNDQASWIGDGLDYSPGYLG
jgi:hypothetical protein